jgi:DNA-binding SARP family transcriptional activator
LEACAESTIDPSPAVDAIGAQDSIVLSMAAEAIVARIADCSPDALSRIRDAATQVPWRWLAATRSACRGLGRNRLPAARLLEEIGESEDVSLLRSIARATKDGRAGSLGRALARRLATHVMVEDLGRVRIVVRDREVEGSDVRRKVLGLLCLLLTRPRWTATREEVVDGLWPDLEPQSAVNSLNQTVYFLRRVFEPEYKEDVSPGYVMQDGETIWLDPELIDARSRRCLVIIRSVAGDPDAESSLALAREYRGKFALDFAYEEWAGTFRDSLHAAYLRVIESALRLDVDSGNYSRGVLLAERAYEVEPDSEELQLALVRIYRLAGAHAAAAEQYAHYARSMRDLGIEPRPIADLDEDGDR